MNDLIVIISCIILGLGVFGIIRSVFFPYRQGLHKYENPRPTPKKRTELKPKKGNTPGHRNPPPPPEKKEYIDPIWVDTSHEAFDSFGK